MLLSPSAIQSMSSAAPGWSGLAHLAIMLSQSASARAACSKRSTMSAPWIWRKSLRNARRFSRLEESRAKASSTCSTCCRLAAISFATLARSWSVPICSLRSARSPAGGSPVDLPVAASSSQPPMMPICCSTSAGGLVKWSITFSTSRNADAISITICPCRGAGSGRCLVTSVIASSSLIRCWLPSGWALALNEATRSRKRAVLFCSPPTYCTQAPFSASRRECMS